MRSSLAGTVCVLLSTLCFAASNPAPAEEPPRQEWATTDEEAARRLRTRVDFHFDDAPLSELARFVQERAKVEVQLDKLSLDLEGVSGDTPIAVHLHGVELRRGLDVILRLLKLGWYLEEGRVVVSSLVDDRLLDRVRTLRVYNCRDLLRLAPAAAEPLYRGYYGHPTPTLEEARSWILLDALLTADEIGDWTQCDDCFSDTEVRMFRGLFVFRARPEVHARIEKLLKMLRDAAGDELEKQ